MTSEVEKVITEFEVRKLYGSVELKFQAGRIVLVKRTQTLVPEPYKRSEDDDEKS